MTAATGAAVTHYIVEWKESSDDKYEETVVQSDSLFLTNLEAGATYNIRVTAVTHRDNRSQGSQIATLNKVATGDTLAPKSPTSPTKTGGYRTVTSDGLPQRRTQITQR